jgi:RNA polymerase sigma factor (sigma-70 family)
MTRSQQNLGALIEQIRHGSESASEDLVARYGTHILRVVRHRLGRSLRPRFDSQDFVQAVWASFFAILPQRNAFDQPEELIAFLAELAQNKVIEAVRQRLQSQKHNLNRERPHSPTSPQAEKIDERQPSPCDIAIAREEWQRLLERQPAHYQRILELLREGHGQLEVAKEMGVNEKTVRRVIDKLAPRTRHES